MVDGQSAFAYFSATYRFIAIDSQIIVPLSSSAGTCPLGFIFRYPGDRVSPPNPTSTCSYLTQASSSAHRLRAARDIADPYSLIIPVPPVIQSVQRYCYRRLSIRGVEDSHQLLERHLCAYRVGPLHLFEHSPGYTRNFLARHADVAQPRRHLELADELGRAIGAFHRRRMRTARVEAHVESLRDRREAICRDSRHETHHMRQRDA